MLVLATWLIRYIWVVKQQLLEVLWPQTEFQTYLTETEIQKTDLWKSVFCRHLLKKLHPAVPTGIEPAVRNILAN